MSSPITSVTENRVTITANDSEENIRAAAGFSEKPAEPEKVDKAAAEVDKEPVEAVTQSERNADGTFKAKEKAEEAEKAEKEPEQAAKPDGDPRKSIQAKINSAIAKQRDAERRAEEAERRLAAREAEWSRPQQPVQSPTSAQAAPPPYLLEVQRYQAMPTAPKLEAFAGLDDPYAAYQVAMATFISDQRLAEHQQRESASRAEQQKADRQRASLDAGEQAYPGFTEQLRNHPITYSDAAKQVFQEELLQDPQLSAEIMHYLLTHLDDAQRLAQTQTPIAAARELGRISERLSSASSGPETVVTHTNAKPLIKPVGASVKAPESASPDDLPFSQYLKVMNDRDRKAREARGA